MSNVIELRAGRRYGKTEAAKWEQKFQGMDKLELLEHMVGYQERRAAAGEFPKEMIAEGVALFGALERSAETEELRLLTRSYRRHLEYERDHA